MHCFIVSIAKLTSILQEVVDFTKKQKERKEKERHRKKQHIHNNIKRVLESQYVKQSDTIHRSYMQ